MAQRNVLQYIILGLLDQRPLTGYELTKAFDSDIGEFWSAQHSQIYPQLRKLEEAALIKHEDEISGEKLTRKRYDVMPAGQVMLNDWLASDATESAPGKDEFPLKLYFIRTAQDRRLGPMLWAQQSLHEQKLIHLRHQMATKFPEGVGKSDFGHYLVLDYAVRRETAYCAWLTDAIARVEA